MKNNEINITSHAIFILSFYNVFLLDIEFKGQLLNLIYITACIFPLTKSIFFVLIFFLCQRNVLEIEGCKTSYKFR